MPVTRATGEETQLDPAAPPTDDGVAPAAAVIVALVVALIAQVAAAVAAQLRAGLLVQGRRLARPRTIDVEVSRRLTVFDRQMTPVVARITAAAYRRGAEAAHLDLGQPLAAPRSPGGEIETQLLEQIRATYPQVRRWAAEGYRDVIDEAARDVLGGRRAQVDAAQAAWDRLLARGVTGFVDKAGRRWNLESYVEMAVRTAVVQAAVQGNLDALTAAGHNLVVVSDAGTVCDICRDWRGQVLQIVGQPGRRTVLAARPDGRGHVPVTVRGTVAEALAAGLWHPNCRHVIARWEPGTPVPRHDEDPGADQHRQRLRHLARAARAWDLRAMAALTDSARRKATEKAREWRAALRAHLDR